MLSDHFLNDIVVSLEKPSLSAKAVSYRQFRQMDKGAFKADLRDSCLMLDPSADLDQLVNLYDYTLTALVEKHAPLQRKTLLSRPFFPDSVRRSRQQKDTEDTVKDSGIELICLLTTKCLRVLK
jgi:hypothetical protein